MAGGEGEDVGAAHSPCSGGEIVSLKVDVEVSFFKKAQRGERKRTL